MKAIIYLFAQKLCRHPFVHLPDSRGMRSSQILLLVILLIATLNIFATSDTTTFLAQDTTTSYQPICPYGSGPLYFSTLLAGRSGPYLSRTELTLLNGTEADAEGELIIGTSGGDFETIELVHFCNTELCSFELIWK